MKKKDFRDLVDDFVNEKIFAKVNTKNGFNLLVSEVQKAHPKVLVEIPEWMLDDFGKNKVSDEYYLVFYGRTNKIKCADKEFFDYVYKTAWPQPFKNTNRRIKWFVV